MQIWRTRKSGKPIDSTFVDFDLCFANGFTLRSCNDERLQGITGSRHLYETVIVPVGPGQLYIEVIAVRKSANGLRRHEYAFRESRHGSVHWNTAKWFCK